MSQSALNKIFVGIGMNTVIGVPVFGVLASIYAENLGGYQDPYLIDEYRFNPNDQKWYAISPAPGIGQFAWEQPANNQARRLG